jgi:hypothetical protein
MGTSIKLPPPTAAQKAYLERIAEESKPLPQKKLGNFFIPGPNFDVELSPRAEQNRRAAEVRGWNYDEKERAYRNADGALVADQFGQLY